jgi:hypothetical protein
VDHNTRARHCYDQLANGDYVIGLPRVFCSMRLNDVEEIPTRVLNMPANIAQFGMISGRQSRPLRVHWLVPLVAMLTQVAQAEPPPASAAHLPRAAAATEVSVSVNSVRAADSRAKYNGHASSETRATAAAGAWQPRAQDAQSFPATFSSVPLLTSRDYLAQLSLPTMGGDGRGIRDQSPTEQLIRQVRKEGMPLARLWQNDEALVSLGLNPKGKPGLWLIQRTR